MHLELVELLRCPVNHAPGVLVASADEIENRYVTSGLLGCPECFAEYSVRRGVTHFAEPAGGSANTASAAVDRDVAMRLAAQIGLSAGRTVFALVGFTVEMAIAMRDIVAARVIAINVPDAAQHTANALAIASSVAPLGVVTCGELLPLAARKYDGIAFANNSATDALLNQSVLALRPGARLVAPVNVAVPAGMRELVRDHEVWVAEKNATASAPISLTRR